LPTADWANRLASAPRLRDLEIRDNALTDAPRLDAGFIALTRLDLSYNEIRSVAPVEALGEAAGGTLRELYLANNKIAALVVGQGAAAAASDGDERAAAAAAAASDGNDEAPTVAPLRHLTALDVLELGSNRIRRVEGLEGQAGLRELWLGRNRIGPDVGGPKALSHLTRLRRLSLQSNRLESMRGLEALTSLEELYLSHNGIRVLEGLGPLTLLRVLDVSSNRLERIGGGGGGEGAAAGPLSTQAALEDLWLNDNAIADFSSLRDDLVACARTLTTVYLDGNPAARAWRSEGRYRHELCALLPSLEQLDSDVLPAPGEKRDAWVAAEGTAPVRGPEADAAALREAAAAAASRRAARAAREAENKATAAEGGGGGGGDGGS
jgi:protein phosphatase 1 regulatory subunit 7